MDVGKLLHLQGAFQRHGEVHAAAEEKKIWRAVEVPREIFELIVLLQHALELLGQCGQRRQELLGLGDGKAVARLRQVNREEVKRRQLRGEGLGGAHANFRAGVRVNGAMRFPRHHAAQHVADGQRLRKLGLGLALAGDGVRRFAGLGDQQGQRLRIHQRIAVAEFRGVMHFHRHARQVLDHHLSRQARVARGPGGDNADFLERHGNRPR